MAAADGPDTIPPMSVDVLTTSVIKCSVERVTAYVADPDNAPLWYANIESVEWETTPPLGEGSRVAFVARFLGRRLAYTYEVIDSRPARGW